ncbi:Ger(x)C family spore germination protein [Lysinibacillus sp. BW-2-10]|uniref:Ger(x)C family spore germination protein n=1 Tax=Lysinibacillus sp. BW-2-10 TaxID=2590030 RepID=UPI00117F4D1B|nr:Ger(x)C family spore germination protein [Lysinibacillus sp. BW-2-10]TSI05115.1 Ger(x)C family spore germination protein [Lysinibacillus sp. BW-2-10]
MQKTTNKTRLFILLILSMLTLLSGCEFKDIDKVTFISMIGIDQSDNSDKPFKVTVKLYVPTSSFKQSPKPQYAYLTENGETLSEAIRLLETHSDKKLDFGHAKLVIIGEELLKANKEKEILDLLIRRPDIQLISWVAVGRPTAEEIIKMVPKSETAAYPAIFNYFDDNGTESPYSVSTFLFDFRRRMVESGIDAILPIIEMEQEESQFKINKAYVLADGKKPHELSSHNTMLYNLLSMNIDIGDLIVNEEGHSFIAKIDTIKSKYKVKVQNDNQVRLDLDIKLFGYVSESKQSMQTKLLPQYNQLLEAEAKKSITDFFTEMLEAGYDPLGFGLKYKATTLPNQRMSMEEWQDAYKNAEIHLNITSGIKSTGTIQ